MKQYKYSANMESRREIKERIRFYHCRLREIRELRQLVITAVERHRLYEEENQINRQLERLLEELRLLSEK